MSFLKDFKRFSGAGGGGKTPAKRKYQGLQLGDVGLDVLEQAGRQESRNHGDAGLEDLTLREPRWRRR